MKRGYNDQSRERENHQQSEQALTTLHAKTKQHTTDTLLQSAVKCTQYRYIVQSQSQSVIRPLIIQMHITKSNYTGHYLLK